MADNREIYMEIGGEFYLDPNRFNKTPYNVVTYLEKEHPLFFDSGRSALCYATQQIRHGTVLLPEYMCDSVIKAFRGFRIRFYRLKPSLEIDLDDLNSKIDDSVSCVFLMHYFGALQTDSTLKRLKEIRRQYECVIIEDTTHSVFSEVRTIGDICVCSLRKWFALPGGGVLYGPGVVKTDKFAQLPHKTDNDRAYGMICKALFIAGKLDCNHEYLEIFRETEERLDKQTKVYQISDFSRFILHTVAVDAMISQRKQNLMRVKEALRQMGITPLCQINGENCPLVLPVWVKKRDELRERLMERRIYCAVHWPFDGVQVSERPLARELAAHMISLPIDQRYGIAHMDYLMEVVNKYRGLFL